MPIKIKLLLLPLAALALAAAAPAAQAQPHFLAGGYPTALAGGQPIPHIITIQGSKLECEEVEFHGTIAAESATVELAPEYRKCDFAGVKNAEVQMNGCVYRYTLGETKPGGSEDEYLGPMEIVCPEGKEMTIVNLACTVHIPAQALASSGMLFTNETATNKVDFTYGLTGIHSKVTSGFFCPLSEKATDTSGKYTGRTRISGNGGAAFFISMF